MDPGLAVDAVDVLTAATYAGLVLGLLWMIVLRTGRWSRQLILVAAFGAVFAAGAFWATSRWSAPLAAHSAPVCTHGTMTTIQPGFDPWTGMAHGWAFVCDEGQPNPRPMLGVFPDDLVGRWAVPLPIGFLIGALAISVIVWTGNRRRTGLAPMGAS